MKHEVTVELAGGKRLTFETGRMAKQASGAALVTMGDNVVLGTAVASPDAREGIDFFPLTVDYREYAYAGGRIPGGFIKREGRPSEREGSSPAARSIGPFAPCFPEGFRNETLRLSPTFVFSADKGKTIRTSSASTQQAAPWRSRTFPSVDRWALFASDRSTASSSSAPRMPSAASAP